MEYHEMRYPMILELAGARLEEGRMDFRRFRVYVDEVAEGKGFDTDEAFPVLAMKDGKEGTELLVPDIKKKLTWVKIKNTKFMGLSKV
jgi:hypothetical protein